MLFILVTVDSLVNVSYHQLSLITLVCKEILFDHTLHLCYRAS